MGANNASFGDAAGQIARTSATSGNPASTGASFDALARSKGVAGGKEAGDIQIANAQEKDSQQAEGLNLLSSLYNTNTGAQTSLLGGGANTLNARAAGGNTLANIIQPIVGAAGAAACWIAASVFEEDFATGLRTNLVRDWLWNSWSKHWYAKPILALYQKHGKWASRQRVIVKALSPLFHSALRKAQGGGWNGRIR